MFEGKPTGGGFPSFNSIVNQLSQLTQAVASMANAYKSSFPQATGTTNSATAGSQTLPANPAGFITVTLPNGNPAKLPYYNP